MFRTPIKIEAPNYSISHEDNIFLIGSCFAENIYRRLNQLQFKTIQNPFGILYNPFSIYKMVDRIVNEKSYQFNDLFFHNDLWHSYDHHGKFSDPNQHIVLQNINQSILMANKFLKKTTVLGITLGTANVYELNTNHTIVANCHKVPNHHFSKKLCSVEDVIESLTKIITQTQAFCHVKSNLKIILTVSPIRHIKDGFIENQRSKSTLLLAIAQIEKQFSNVFYFPAYEILMDDLRDYRFYEKDMIHPNDIAIDYIWNNFTKSFFDKNTIDLNTKIQKIIHAKQHRLLHPNTLESIKFKERLTEQIKALESDYPFLNFIY